MNNKFILPDTFQQSGQPVNNNGHYIPLALTVFWLIQVAALCLYLLLIPLNHDVAWYLYGAKKMVSSGVLYKDIVDVNPPLIFFINIPAAWLAKFLGVFEVPLLHIYFLLLFVFSFLLCARLARYLLDQQARIIRLFFLFVCFYVFFIFPMSEFGQREHIMFVFVTPYILLLMARAEGAQIGRILAVTAGILAGLGLCLKPYFFILWIAEEIYVIFIARCCGWKRPENIAVFLTAGIIGLVFLAFAAEFFALLPVLIEIYKDVGVSAFSMLRRYPTVIWLISSVVLMSCQTESSQGTARFRILLIASTTLYLSAVLQKKGWFYHYYPFLAVNFLAAFFVFIQLLKSERVKPAYRPYIVKVVVLIGALLMTAGGIKQLTAGYFDPHRHMLIKYISVVKKHASDRPVYFMTSNVTLPFPVVNYSRTSWPVRFHYLSSLWTAYDKPRHSGRIVQFHTPGQMGRAERYVFDKIIADLVETPPELIMVDIMPQPTLHMRYFDFMRYFLQDRKFRELFKDYELFENVDDQLLIYRQAKAGDNPDIS